MFSEVTDIFKDFEKKHVTIQDRNGIILVVDATRAEEHGYQAQATEHEIEDVGQITDHIIKKGVFLTIHGVVSDSPISMTAALLGTAAGGVGSLIDGRAGAIATGVLAKGASAILSGNLLYDSKKPSIEAFQALQAIYRWSKIVTVITGLDAYTNMVMENLNIPRNSQNGASLEFSATFKKISIAQSDTVDIPPELQEENLDAAPKKKQGTKGLGAITDGIKKKGESMLHSMFGGVFE